MAELTHDPKRVRRDDSGRYLGGFWPDGAWNPNGDFCSPLDWLVRRLNERRRLTQNGPDWYAEVIKATEGGRFIQGFTPECLRVWSECSDWQLWRMMPAPTSAAESVKRAGLGQGVPGEWAGGYWMPADHPRLLEYQQRAAEIFRGTADIPDFAPEAEADATP